MKLNPVPSDVARTGLRAVKSVCLSSSGEELSELQKQFLNGVQKSILQTEFDIDALEPITPTELASLVQQDEFKNRIVRACIVAACVDGDVDKIEAARIQEFAEALRVDMAPIRTAWNLAKKNILLSRLDIVRKALPGFKIKETFQTQGLIATAKQFFPLLGVELPEVTARYRKLFEYPAGTLGKKFTEYIEENKFPLPGQKGAGPEIIVTHDCLHILGGYGTSATEEIEIASFQAGCNSQDPIYGLLFGLAQYHLGIQVAPIAASQKMQANPEKMIAAFARGCKMKRDMWGDFDPWKFFDRQVDELRVEFGIEPK